MAIAKAASRNMAFKVARMRESIIYYGGSGRAYDIRKSDCEEVGLEASDKAALEDIGHNATCVSPTRQSRGQRI